MANQSLIADMGNAQLIGESNNNGLRKKTGELSNGRGTAAVKMMNCKGYGVRDMEGSAKRIYSAAVRTPEGHSVVLLAHNGPTGLGSKRNDICGRDWGDGGGDHGDPDLAQAILDLKKNSQLCVPLVVFGHMHKELAYGKGVRKMIVVGEDNTIYLNGAIVPRVERLSCEKKTSSKRFNDEIPSASFADSNGTVRAFTVVDMLDGKVDKIAESWVLVIGDEIRLKEEHILFKNGI
ncbi:hypothetical protein IFM89_004329 [Coptis chinensis]|uniref:Calcineurin-like phosphoesterase domain-containing protein n=1 Tax=Coptis chinensis TaxID=261450 RepID=A0A835IBP1_9MAGN|nr:hypothetical protein IFM89_004329 [Coptis chinensis]